MATVDADGRPCVSPKGTFLILNVAGYSVNILTLLAMVLAVGVVVDDAIVVLENIFRHIEDGMEPLEAAIKGVKEITAAVIAITITIFLGVTIFGASYDSFQNLKASYDTTATEYRFANLTMSGGDRLSDCDPFGANRQSVGSVLDVGAREQLTILPNHHRTDPEIGIR